jgi:hypothetical protein
MFKHSFMFNSFIALMGKWLMCLLRLSCTTAADALVKYSAMVTDVYVPQRPEISPSPDGKTADSFASTLTCTTVTAASVNYSMYVQQRIEIFPSTNFPSPRWENG